MERGTPLVPLRLQFALPWVRLLLRLLGRVAQSLHGVPPDALDHCPQGPTGDPLFGLGGAWRALGSIQQCPEVPLFQFWSDRYSGIYSGSNEFILDILILAFQNYPGISRAKGPGNLNQWPAN